MEIDLKFKPCQDCRNLKTETNMAHDILNTTIYTKNHLEFSDTDDTFVDEHGDMWTASDCLEEVRGLILDGEGSGMLHWREDPIATLQIIENLVSLDVKEDFYETNSDITLPKARGDHFSTSS